MLHYTMAVNEKILYNSEERNEGKYMTAVIGNKEIVPMSL